MVMADAQPDSVQCSGRCSGRLRGDAVASVCGSRWRAPHLVILTEARPNEHARRGAQWVTASERDRAQGCSQARRGGMPLVMRGAEVQEADRYAANTPNAPRAAPVWRSARGQVFAARRTPVERSTSASIVAFIARPPVLSGVWRRQVTPTRKAALSQRERYMPHQPRELSGGATTQRIVHVVSSKRKSDFALMRYHS